MNVLFVTGHPAQVHNFRLVRDLLIANNHTVYWLTTPKDIATNLLDCYNIPYETLIKPKTSFFSRMFTMLRNTARIFRFIKRNKIDICVTRTDPYTAIAAWLLSVPNIMLQDTEIAATSQLQGPFAKLGTSYIVPECFSIIKRKDEVRFSGNIELFYCHPNRYLFNEPYSILGINKNERYAVVRFVKWDAFHDQNLVGGFSVEQKIKLIKALSSKIKVFISSESDLPEELEKYRIKVPIDRMHDVQACATIFIGESATMASESVVLGTPAVYVDEVGRGYTDEEAREGLLWMYRPTTNKNTLKESEPYWISGGIEECIEKAEEIVSDTFDYNVWKAKHDKWMSTKIDCTKWLAWIIEKYPESVSQWKESRSKLEINFK